MRSSSPALNAEQVGGSSPRDVTDAAPRRRLILIALSAGGYAFTLILLWIGFSNGQWPFPGGDVVAYFAPAGEAVRNGTAVYVASPEFPGFRYGPPWAVAFAPLSLGGPALIHAFILVLDGIALLALARGSLLRLGFILWFPLISFELAAGQLNLLIAAAIVVAQRGVAWPLAIVSFAKVWPALALRPADWRKFALAVAIVALVTLPWLPLWPAWIGSLINTADTPHGPLIPVPFAARAVIAALLIALQRPWSRALGAILASPNLYWGQLVVLVAPLAVWLDPPRAADAPAGDGSPRAGDAAKKRFRTVLG